MDSVDTAEMMNESQFSIEDEQENDVDLIYDTRISNSLFTQLVVAEYCNLFFAMSGLILAIIAREARVNADEEDELIIYSRVVFWSMACTLCLLISLVIRYDLWLRWSITVQKYTKYDSLYNTGIWKQMIAELILNAMAPYPFLDGFKYNEYVKTYDTWISYEINDLMLVI